MKISKTAVRAILLIILCCTMIVSYDYYKIMKNNNPITYSIISFEKLKAYRGSDYVEFTVKFNNAVYNVDIDISEYEEYIETKQFPILYFSERNNKVFSKRHIYQINAFSVVFGIFLTISLIPFERISKKMDEDIKRKSR